MRLVGPKVVMIAAFMVFFASDSTRTSGKPVQQRYDGLIDSQPMSAGDLQAINQRVNVQVNGRTIVLHVYLPADNRPDSPLVLYSSGSGGWHGFDGYVAKALASHGMPVCGVSIHSYLKDFYSTSHPATFDQLVGDYVHIISQARAVTGSEISRPIILAGWSLGAGYAPLVGSAPEVKPSIQGIISITISRDNETALSVGNRLLSRLTGKTFGPSFDIREYLARAAPIPIAIIQPHERGHGSTRNAALLIDESTKKNPAVIRLFEVDTASSHSFADSRLQFDQALSEALSWIDERKLQPNLTSLQGLAH